MGNVAKWRALGIALVLGLLGDRGVFAEEDVQHENRGTALVMDEATSATSPNVKPASFKDAVEEDGGQCQDLIFSQQFSQRDTGVIAYGEWLNWKASLTGAALYSIVTSRATPGGGSVTDITIPELGFQQSGGMRVGLGYRVASRWELVWNYTYFNTSGAFSATSTQDTRIWDWKRYYDSVAETYSLAYNLHDIEAGRWIDIDDTFGARLFGGFRWARIDILRNSVRVPTNSTSSESISEEIGLDAYGIRLGAEGRWKIRNTGLSLLARGAGSTLVGRSKTGMGSSREGIPVIEAAAGIAWTRGPWEISGGYENSTWFNVVQMRNYNEIIPIPQSLTLDGFFLRVALVR